MEPEDRQWLNALTARASQLQEALDQLAHHQKAWTQTRAAAQASKAPGQVLQQIDATLAALEAAQRPCMPNAPPCSTSRVG